MDPHSAAIPQVRTPRARNVRGKLFRTLALYGLGVLIILLIVGRHRDNRRQKVATDGAKKYIDILKPVVESTGILPYEMPISPGDTPPKVHDQFTYDPPASPTILREVGFPVIIGATTRVGLATKPQGRAVGVFDPPTDSENAKIRVQWMNNDDYVEQIEDQTKRLAEIRSRLKTP